MPRYGDDEPEYVVEWDDEAYGDDERYSGEAFVVAPRVGGGYGRQVQGAKGGTVSTPAGQAQIQFQQSMVTLEDFRKAMDKVEADVRRESAAVKALDEKVEKRTSSLRKDLKGMQSMSLLPMFLQQTPSLTSFTATKPGEGPPGTVYTVSSTTFAPQDTTTLLLMVMMMGGGSGGSLFGGKGGEDGMMDMLMILLLTKGLGGSASK